MASNFTQNEQTGAVAEDEVGIRFTKWGWSVGRDRIDAGYDLFVEPDRVRYRGSRFLVQVKGTIQKRRGASLVALVDKHRLVEYVRNPHPVFLVRVAPDDCLYWLHIQEWAKSNRSRLTGSGVARISMKASRNLSDRDAFERYLDKILAPANECAGALAKMAEERATFLSDIDPRFLVKVGLINGREQHEIFARSESTETRFSFQPDKRADNISNLKEALQYGLPRKVEVSQFQLSGSPLFEALGMSNKHSGALTIGSKPRKGIVRIHPGRRFSPMAQCLEIEAELFIGQKGFAISSDSLNGLFQIDARIDERGRGNTTFDLRQSMLTSIPIQDLTELAIAGTWAEQIAEEKAMLPEIIFAGGRTKLQPSELSIETIGWWLYHVRTLSRLHLIARCLDLNFIVSADCILTEDETKDISFAYHLLRGARLSAGNVSMEIESSASFASMKPGKDSHGFWVTSSIVLTAGGQEFATLPVAIELPDYVLEPVADSSRLRVHSPLGEKAWITYAPDGPNDVFLRRISQENQ